MTEPGPPQPFDPPSGSQPVGQPYGSQPFPGQEQQYGQQGYGQQPYGQPPAGQRRNGLGVAALVLGVLAVLTCFTVVIGFVLGLLAIVFGVIGRGRARRGEADNRGVATAGLVLGAIGLVLSIGFGVAVGSLIGKIANTPEGQRLQECVQQADGDRARAQACQDEFARSQNG